MILETLINIFCVMLDGLLTGFEYIQIPVTIVRMDVVDKVVKKFRPIIRGFMWLMLVFYNINQFLHFIGQESMTLGGIIKTADAESKRSWLDG